ncbi:ADP-ribosylglycohydrolase family protein [Haloechinothrix sp. LS1_15]|uniref:ADP-ribosylglycohydrolase family protein n=1 Tax=Haloechinothrix sp. LS1_15 TaxID=2652248 RepID=UPI002947033D|nr:ADP-ribosylglycohydrolase family protein [Haloechinothrix sp. LS1_15]MDV6011277.1 ADP-ribosylglycohydrolase [Haloechinothrix sp. LS1_15]
MTGREQRILGLLLGTALGDAFGAAFEGRPFVDGSEVDAATAPLASAEVLVHTDDTALTLVLAEHIADRVAGRAAVADPLDEDALAREFAAAWRGEPWRGYGSGAALIFKLICEGAPWREATYSLFGGAGSYGNGGAMRAAPVAIAGNGLHLAAELGRRQAVLTHAHEHGQRGAELQAAASYLALERDPAPLVLDADQFRQDLARVVRSREWHEKLDRIGELLLTGAPPEHAARALGNDVSALGSVPLALLAFLTTPDDPVATVRYAIRAGGDTDTIAAMAGALSGARNGVAALPESWIARVEARQRIERVANRLSGYRPAGLEPPHSRSPGPP